MTEITEQAAHSPAVLYVVVALLVLGAIARAAPGILGPLGQAYSEWAERRRRSAIAREDAEVTDLREQVAEVRTEFAEFRRRTAEDRVRDRARLAEHAAWDRQVYAEVVRLGGHIELPPPLT